MKTEKFLIILGIGLVIILTIILWMAWKGYQLQKGKVLISTDKTEYEPGGILKVKIKNNFGENICFSSCYPYLLESKNEKWESYKYVECHEFNGNGHCVKAGELKAFELTLPQISDGSHRLAIPVCVGCKNEDSFKEDTRFYSNEFWVREKKEEVTIATDKTEYEEGETVKITAKNNSAKSIWYYPEGCGKPFWHLHKLEDDELREIMFSFPNLKEEEIESQRMYIEVCDFILCERIEPTELKPNSEISYNWSLGNICEWPLKPIGVPETKPELIEKGTYRISFIYGLNKEGFNLLDWKTTYSNEFTIKEKKTQEETVNCNQYQEMPMSQEEIEKCICPEGYIKFYGLSRAFCATNSQKPCKSRADCPKNEFCISDDGKTWYCTGKYTGCYHYDPENPEKMMCVD